MPRFALREFSEPDYVSTLPAHDPNDALWPRISMLAKMLNEIPWLKKKTEEKQNTEKTPQEELAEEYSQEMSDYDHSPQEQAEKASAAMEGYDPVDKDYLQFDPKTASKAEIKDMQRELASGGGDLGKWGADGKWGKMSQKAYNEYNAKLNATRHVQIPSYDRTPAMVRELERAQQWAKQEQDE